MTIEITGRASGHDDYTNIGVARESVQRFGERVAHLRVEVDALCAPESDDRNSVSHFRRQNIGVHRVLPKWQRALRCLGGSLNGFRCGANHVDDAFRLGEHRHVAAVELIGGSAHTLG